ncbi:MAG: hypothetical protein ACYS3N_16735 [Planctomycetota bacterium]|jgi:hypothetical protein
MPITVEQMKSAREAVSEVRLEVGTEEALRYMRGVRHRGFLKSLRSHWLVDENGQATIQSICWLFCWATVGNNPINQKTADACSTIFGKIFDHSYEWFAREVTYELAKKLRYDKSDIRDKNREFTLINQYLKQKKRPSQAGKTPEQK